MRCVIARRALEGDVRCVGTILMQVWIMLYTLRGRALIFALRFIFRIHSFRSRLYYVICEDTRNSSEVTKNIPGDHIESTNT